MTIRQARPDDAPLIAEQRRRMFLDMGQDAAAVNAAHEAFLDWVRGALESGAYAGFLAEDDGRVVGGLGLLWQDWPPSPLYPDTRRAYLLNVYTAPEARGRGLATRLVRHALQFAHARGVRTVNLHASDAGRSVYQAQGFAPTNELRLRLPEELP